MDARLAISVGLQQRHRLVGLTANFEINPNIFADNKQLARLDTDDWQIIYGRRGAGKTTLLATFAKYITQHEKTLKRASIEITTQQIIPEIIYKSKKSIDPDVIAQHLFGNFIHRISEHLFDVFSSKNENSKFVKAFLQTDKKQYIQDLITRLHTSTERFASTIDIKQKTKKKIIKKHKNSNDKSGSASGSASLKLSAREAPKAALGVAVSVSGSAQSSETTEEVQEIDLSDFEVFIIPFNDTRKIIEELLGALNIEKLYIFLDEWSEIDPTARKQIQPLFLKYVKKVFWRNPRFVFKIGAIRNQTKLNYNTSVEGIIGLEAGADIFEIDLDDLYSSKQFDRYHFFEELLFRQLCFCNPDIASMRAKGEYQLFQSYVYQKPSETFIGYIFRNNDVFKTLVDGSGGVPRDFLEMVDTLARDKDYKVEPTWTMREIKEKIRTHFVHTKHQSNSFLPQTKDILKQIMIKVQNNNHRLILFDLKSSIKAHEAIAELYHRRLLHDISPLEIPALIRNDYIVYYADLGLHLDLRRERVDDVGLEEVAVLSGSESSSELEKFVISGRPASLTSKAL